MNPAIAISLFFCLFVVNSWYRRQVRRRFLPPGPKGWPLVGNVGDIPSDYSWIGYAALANQYGDIMYLKAMGQPMLILSSLRSSIDLLDKRSANYSDRPWSRMLHDLMGWKWAVSLMPYGYAWRKRRRMLQNYFSQKAADKFLHIQQESANTLVQNLLDDPCGLFEHIAFLAGSSTLKITYDYDCSPKDDSLISLEDATFENLNEATRGGAYLVDSLPILQFLPKWFPGSGFQSLAAEARKLTTRMQNEPFEDTKRRMNEKTASSCLTVNLLSELEDENNLFLKGPDGERSIKEVAGIIYAGGVETTTSTLSTFFLAMIHFPEVQRKAQGMIDAAVGHDRLPTFEDKLDLPYIQCIVQETLRWHPVAPLGVAHKSVHDDVYGAYHIPAGTIVTTNIWAMMRNEADYPDPEVFNPDRFVAKEGKVLPPDPVNIAFGFGRRICPGRYFALNAVWIAIACILSTFTIAKDIDEHGKEITPEIAFTSGVTSHPKPFKYRLIPRSEKRRDIIQSTS